MSNNVTYVYGKPVEADPPEYWLLMDGDEEEGNEEIRKEKTNYNPTPFWKIVQLGMEKKLQQLAANEPDVMIYKRRYPVQPISKLKPAIIDILRLKNVQSTMLMKLAGFTKEIESIKAKQRIEKY